ncbi:hypothetical protein [Methylomonas sp. MgM2]
MNIYAFKGLLLIGLLLIDDNLQASVDLGFSEVSRTADSVDMALEVSGLDGGVASSLSTYDLDVHFDSTHLTFAGVVFGDATLGDQLDLFGFASNPIASHLTEPGVVNVFELSLDTPENLDNLQADRFVLATLSFDIINIGTTRLYIDVNAFADANGNPIVPIVSSATISNVPLPASAGLMVAGLGVMLKRKWC